MFFQSSQTVRDAADEVEEKEMGPYFLDPPPWVHSGRLQRLAAMESSSRHSGSIDSVFGGEIIFDRVVGGGSGGSAAYRRSSSLRLVRGPTNNSKPPNSRTSFAIRSHAYKGHPAWRFTKKLVSSTFGLFLVIQTYLCLGAFCFMWLESAAEDRNLERMASLRMDVVQRIVSCSGNNTCIATKIREWETTLVSFPIIYLEIGDGYVWNWVYSYYCSFTIVSTIGYGNVTPLTVAGRLFTVAYAIVGIPLMLLFITNTGNTFARWTKIAIVSFRKWRHKISRSLKIGRRRNDQDVEATRKEADGAVVGGNGAGDPTEQATREGEGSEEWSPPEVHINTVITTLDEEVETDRTSKVSCRSANADDGGDHSEYGGSSTGTAECEVTRGSAGPGQRSDKSGVDEGGAYSSDVEGEGRVGSEDRYESTSGLEQEENTRPSEDVFVDGINGDLVSVDRRSGQALARTDGGMTSTKQSSISGPPAASERPETPYVPNTCSSKSARTHRKLSKTRSRSLEDVSSLYPPRVKAGGLPHHQRRSALRTKTKRRTSAPNMVSFEMDCLKQNGHPLVFRDRSERNPNCGGGGGDGIGGEQQAEDSDTRDRNAADSGVASSSSTDCSPRRFPNFRYMDIHNLTNRRGCISEETINEHDKNNEDDDDSEHDVDEHYVDDDAVSDLEYEKGFHATRASAHLSTLGESSRRSSEAELALINIPLWLALLLLLVYLFVGAGSFAAMQSWTFLDGFYYSFISLSTIGFGDLVFLPQNIHAGLIFSFLYSFFGLCFTSMCMSLSSLELTLLARRLSAMFGVYKGRLRKLRTRRWANRRRMAIRASPSPRR